MAINRLFVFDSKNNIDFEFFNKDMDTILHALKVFLSNIDSLDLYDNVLKEISTFNYCIQTFDSIYIEISNQYESREVVENVWISGAGYPLEIIFPLESKDILSSLKESIDRKIDMFFVFSSEDSEAIKIRKNLLSNLNESDFFEEKKNINGKSLLLGGIYA
jgi:hypothetical protein